MSNDSPRIVRAACPHDCPDTCAMEVTVEQGRAVKIRGAKSLPFTNGALCTKVAHYLERVYSEQRLLYPMKRVGRKGEGRFERIGWDEALDTIADRFRAIAADDPRAILPYSYAGTMGLVQSSGMDRRFFHRLGASLLDRTICASAGAAGWKATIGAGVGMDPEAIVEARLIIVWGGNPVVSNLHGWRYMQEAKRRGARLVVIDPWRSETALKADLHLAPMPGTDAALALAMMQVLIDEDLLDHDYIASHTLGFDALAERVREWTPEAAAMHTGLPAEVIRQLARDYGKAAPSAIRLNYGLNRCAGGAAAVRAIACLPALTGAWRHAAGGALLSTSGSFPVDVRALERPDLYPDAAARPPRTVNMSQIGEALLGADDPPIRAIYVYNSNPLAVAPDSNRVRAGFMREDLFCVVHEQFQTDTADYADILLPATSQLEHRDVHKAYGHLNVVDNQPAITPLGEARPNSEVFRQLAQRLGFSEPALFESDDEIAAAAFKQRDMRALGLSGTLAEQGWARLNLPRPYAPFARGGFFTPSGRCEFFSQALADQGIDPLPRYVPPHESPLSNPELATRYPLAIISPPARNFLNTSFANMPRFLAQEGRPTLAIHPDDAAARGIAEGDRLRIFNDRGAFHAHAVLTDGARPGLVVAPSIWWQKLSGDGENANAVTSSRLTDMGGGPVFYDCLVEVAIA
ncbi:molybdopterin-containing oxidoreductase family protein [Cognatazoarcus halotolerans]|uniref:molybdopterin-containing oxidoreductase family protein n=1 Tax=Cognatazoarcus halotolerans TaxID=2686016 RepID=UPI00135AAC64|nr:molybdopterin oxidoreductase family protein [Cognatazoarcus halotolerans]MCB1897899.1 molybdopterin oxidoreductase family protein [Rhodocyclaceae bacterium]MCP5310587.1 molybdopterin oxidoreductase family protein [Zoogloeaceae bacterium]